MKPIRQGDRGPAVEDVQRRLVALGYDLGPTGVDGVFLGATQTALRAFQRGSRLADDGIVGEETWAALVDSTFTLGDRMLYLRWPLLHGRDVETLQGALNTLGFACGVPDGIFGAFTERAAREFQLNCGLPADGIVGADTVRAVSNLRHVWEGKEGIAPAEIAVAPARTAQVLASVCVVVQAADGLPREVAERLANLALAAHGSARVSVVPVDAPSGETGLTLRLTLEEIPPAPGWPSVGVDPSDPIASTAHVVAALDGSRRADRAQMRLPADMPADERSLQRAAVAILDGLCAALS